MKKIISSLILITITQSIFSQEKGARIYSYKINEIGFYKYQSDFKVKATKDFKTIKNELPEDLMQSILSCSSEEWEIFNTLGQVVYSNDWRKRWKKVLVRSIYD